MLQTHPLVPAGLPADWMTRFAQRAFAVGASLIVGGRRPRDVVRMEVVNDEAALMEVGEFRKTVVRAHGQHHVAEELGVLGLDAIDQAAWIYVLKLNGRIVASVRAAADCPLSSRHIGRNQLDIILGNPARHVEIGRLVAAPVHLRRTVHALLAFAFLDLFYIRGYRFYAAYMQRSHTRRMNYLASEQRWNFSIVRNRASHDYTLCVGSISHLLKRNIRSMTRFSLSVVAQNGLFRSDGKPTINLRWRPRQAVVRAVSQFLSRRIRDNFFRTLGGHIFFQHLRAAVELDLFGLLARQGVLTREQIGAALKLEERPLRTLLLGCVTTGLIKKRGKRYRNSLIAARYLHNGSPDSIVSMVLWQQYINYAPFESFRQSLEQNTNLGLNHIPGTGATLFDRLEASPKLQGIFYDSMKQQAGNLADVLLDHLDLGDVQHLLDVGGGSGDYAIRIAREFRDIRVSVIDLPAVCLLADEAIIAAGVGDHVVTAPSDSFADPWPEQGDAVLFSHFLTLWSPEKCVYLLRKAYDALPAGGSVIVFNIMQNDTEDGPVASVLGSSYFVALATGESFLYTTKEYSDWIKAAGFRKIRRVKASHDHTILVGIK